MTIVNLQQSVPYSILEKALFKAAEEIGWKAKIKDTFRQEYQLGSVKEINDYNDTVVKLNGKLFPTMHVHFKKRESMDYFCVCTGFPFGVASKNKVRKYLSAVSKNL